MREMIDEFDPDVICYTEVIRSVLPDGHVIEADADYEYPPKEGRRKVILWSKTPWTEIDPLGYTGMPSGRFVSGVAEGIRFVGVCIPWKDAHVNSGRRNRQPWEDHLFYCAGLERFLHRHSAPGPPVCVLGDYNQRIPRATQPQEVLDALRNAIPSSYSIVTGRLKDASGKDLIDHISPLEIGPRRLVPEAEIQARDQGGGHRRRPQARPHPLGDGQTPPLLQPRTSR